MWGAIFQMGRKLLQETGAFCAIISHYSVMILTTLWLIWLDFPEKNTQPTTAVEFTLILSRLFQCHLLHFYNIQKII